MKPLNALLALACAVLLTACNTTTPAAKTPSGDALYVCGCGGGCQCHTPASTEPGKCKCGKDLKQPAPGMGSMVMGHMHMNGMSMETNSAFAQAMMQSMETMDKGMASAPMTGDPDHDFAAMMIPHHQGAIDMAKPYLLYSKDPVLQRLAQEIIVTQQQEIEVMRRRLAELPPASTNAIRNKSSDPVCSPSISTNNQSGNPTNTNHNP